MTVDTMTARYVRSPGSHSLVQLAVLYSPEWQGHPKQGLRQGAVTVGTMTVQHLGSPMSGELETKLDTRGQYQSHIVDVYSRFVGR